MLDILKSEKFRRNAVIIARILLGCVFIFSGFAKAVDPLGGTYKIEDYLTSFGMDFFVPIAFVGSIALSTLEFLLGICLIVGANMKSTSILTLLFMGVMTPLTLYIAIFNPVTDCGCFGDALKISNWATFWKNIVFSALALIVFFWRKYSPSLFSQKTDWTIAIYSGIFAIAVSLYCWIHLPILDFRPYKNGTNIIESMEVPEDAPKDVYETTLIYEKDGVQKKFTLENYPKDDSTWHHIETISEIVEKGYEPPIHDLTMDHPDDGDIIEDVLNEPGYTFWLVSSRVEKAYTYNRKAINAVYDYAKEHGYGFYGMTATGLESQEMKEYIREACAEYPFVNTDEITLKTIVRSNPGLVLIKGGVVVNKWSNKDIPTFDKPLEESELGTIQAPDKQKAILLSIIAFIVPLALIFLLDKILIKFFKKGDDNK
ncbi:MAG: DoxX family protein [Paludibacteraceae bacterium]|nr:DoxX family protein [Paludibacteraceae bacterium]